MIQSILLLILLAAGVAFAQANSQTIHSVIPLSIPGAGAVQLTYLRLLAAFSAALVVVWIGGLLDLAVQRARIHRLAAAIAAKDQAIAQARTTMPVEPADALAGTRARLEAAADDIRATLRRIEVILAALPQRERIVRQDVELGDVRMVRSEPGVRTRLG
jgi:hypothetical protein